MIVDIQFNQGAAPWQHLVEASLAAQDAGFDTLWVLDHFAGDASAGRSMLECFTVLGALAQITSTIKLGPLVANVGNRHPGLLALSAASVQTISDGRLVLGLGAGASPASPWSAELHALGMPIPARLVDRHQRVIDALDLLDNQWAAPQPERWNGFARATPRPPVLLGVNSRPLARLAGARTEGVNVRWNHHDRAGLIAAAVDARDARATQPSTWTSSVWAPWEAALCDLSHPLRRELAAEGTDRLILLCSAPPDVDEIRRAGRYL
jgi:alkanesulfonate monooxygenase SsuD/methylene tetrahydromethanopterin reductase-like flavin-dependent oxidoreductase (luciferase family)